MSGTFVSYGSFTSGKIITGDVECNKVDTSNVIATDSIACPSISGQQIAATIAMATPELASNVVNVEGYTLSQTNNVFVINNADQTATFTVEPY